MTAAAEPVPVAVAPMPPVRLTASTINDDQLDALYAERDLLAAILREVLDTATFERWCAALDGPSEPRTAPTTAPMSPVGLRGAQTATGGQR